MSDLPDLIAAVTADIPPLAKDQEHGQGYRYRSIETIIAEVGSRLATRGVTIRPVQVTPTYDSYEARRGGMMNRCRIVADYEIRHGDDTLIVQSIGEGTDTTDKAPQKAMTAALKYALLQTFAVSDQGEHDPDHGFPDGPVGQMTAVGKKVRLLELLDGDKSLAADVWTVLEAYVADVGSLTMFDAVAGAFLAGLDDGSPVAPGGKVVPGEVADRNLAAETTTGPDGWPAKGTDDDS